MDSMLGMRKGEVVRVIPRFWAWVIERIELLFTRMAKYSVTGGLNGEDQELALDVLNLRFPLDI